MRGRSILIIGTEQWGSLFVSKHYIAKYLAEAGNKVYYLNPVCISWSLKSLWRLPIRTEVTNEGISVVSYGNPVPFLSALPFWLQRTVFWFLPIILRRSLGKHFDLVWTFDLSRFPNLNHWKPSRTLLHLVELFDHPNFETHQPFRREILRSADHVVSIADLITEQILPTRRNVLQLFHGADIRGFTRSLSLREMGAKLPGRNRTKAGFVGNFQFSFNFALLRKLAKGHPDVDFILIGPRSDSSNLGKLEPEVIEAVEQLSVYHNVFFIGPVPSQELMGYLKEIDINLILYGTKFWPGHCNPHKLMAYFYAGKPILASYIHQYRNEQDLMVTVRSDKDFLREFSRLKTHLGHPASATSSTSRREFALNHSYDRLIQEVSDLVFGNEQGRLPLAQENLDSSKQY